MKFVKGSFLATLLTVGILLAGTQARGSQVFEFNGVRDDGEKFFLTLTTEDVKTTETFGPYTNLSGFQSPGYTFSGYRVTAIRGTWVEPVNGILTEFDIVGLMDVGSIVDDPLDNIKHSLTDNLFAPPATAGELALGKVSYGGIGFRVKTDQGIEEYQLFTNPDTGEYAGCPGTCVKVVEVDAPGTLPLMGLGLAVFAWARGSRRRRAQGR